MKLITMSVAAVVAAAGGSVALGQLDVKTRTAAAQGGAAPGAGANVFFNIFNAGDPTNAVNAPSINSAGAVAFRTDLTGTGTAAATNAGVWAGQPGALQMIARKGSTAADLPAGVNYNNFSNVHLNDAGQVRFLADLTGAGITSANNEALFGGVPGALQLIAQRGAAAPGVPAPGVFSDFDNAGLAFSADGHGLARATLTGAGITTATDRGLWGSGPAGGHLIAREGSQAAGCPAGVLYGQFDDVNGSGASSGQISNYGAAWYATLTGAGVTTANDSALWVEPAATPGTATLVVREGDPASLIAAGTTYFVLSAFSINHAGSVLFRTTLTGGGVVTANNTALIRYQSTGAAYDVVARKGSAAGDLAAGVNFSDFTAAAGLQPRIGGGERVAFLATLTGTGVVTANNQALFVGAAGSALHAALRKGDAPPGAGAGQTFGTFDSIALGSNGGVIVSGRLTGTGVTTANDGVLYSWNASHGLRLLSREAGVVPVDAADTRTVATSGITILPGVGGQDGYRAAAASSDALGRLTYRGAFSDGSARILVLEAQTFPCGPADIGAQGGVPGFDGALNNNDFIVYINYFFAANPLADVGVQGGVPGSDALFDNNDFIVYINFFFAGC